jgi:Histidine kinase
MTALSLTALVAYLFGAYAYGHATFLALREVSPVWTRKGGRDDRPHHVNRVTLALLVTSTVWFVLQTVLQFKRLAGGTGYGWLDLVSLVIVYLFPPLIMHTVYAETQAEDGSPAGRRWRRALGAMDVLSPAVAAYVVLAILELVPAPPSLNAAIGFSIATLFIAASVYSTAIMYRRTRPAPTTEQRRLRRVMLMLFVLLAALSVALVTIDRTDLLMAVVAPVLNCAPLYFLIASVYFENPFEFYDLVVKRALMLVVSIGVLGGFLMVGMPWLETLPPGAARPWLFALALVPLAMLMPWLHGQMTRWLDRVWFGREFTPVEAVKHVLAGMHPATDEGSLIQATDTRLSEIFRRPIVVLIDDQAPPRGSTLDARITTPLPMSGSASFGVLRQPGARPLLSEDTALLRSLAGVFGFMLENVRLQRRRQEQEQLAQELRLQSSRSELKALRAQINPHFLFNALNAIASLIHTDPARADEAVEQLAEVFRYTLRRSDSEWAPLEQELAFARAYLDVEQARFGRRLTFTIDANEAARAAQVPSMLLHTLVENAVKHGISRLRGPGHIDVSARSQDGRVALEVRDSGPGLDTPGDHTRRMDGESFGLRSVRDRLQGHFGPRAALTLERDVARGQTVARIDMPLIEVHA